MICSSGRSKTSMGVSLEKCRTETGSGREAKWGETPVSFQAGFVRPLGPCFIGVARKAKRNGCFWRCHWESAVPSPPYTVTNRKDPFNINGLDDGQFWVETVFFRLTDRRLQTCKPTAAQMKRGQTSSNALYPSCLTGSIGNVACVEHKTVATTGCQSEFKRLFRFLPILKNGFDLASSQINSPVRGLRRCPPS